MLGLCYDIEGNTVDCGSSDSVGYSEGVSPSDAGAGIDLTSQPTVAGITDAHNNGGSALSSFFGSLPGLISSTVKAVTPTSTTANLRLQLNPATGKMQYFNSQTGQYIGGPVQTSSSLFGNSSLMLVLFALVLAFFAFGGRKRLAA
jgi:hypothetical protein